MIEQAQRSIKAPARRGATRSAAWKSGLMMSGLGAVVLGWALLVRVETSTDAQTIAQVAGQPQAQVQVVQAPVTNLAGGARGSTLRPPSVPTTPQRPIFRQPVTRTRGS